MLPKELFPDLSRKQRRAIDREVRHADGKRFEGLDKGGDPVTSRFTAPSLSARRRARRIANRRAGAARRANRGAYRGQ